MGSKPYFSIIIPVYNASKYIEECVNSIISQTMTNFEVLCIDDGSTDNSLEIIRSYDDYRIYTITQQNSGPSAARNQGIRVAVGKYLIFIDSDDYLINSNALQEIHDVLEYTKADILQGTGEYISSDMQNKVVKSMNIYSKDIYRSQEYLITTLKNRQMFTAQWLGVYKNDLIKNNNISCNINLICGEDACFVFEALKAASNVAVYRIPFYGYRLQPNSIMRDIKYNEQRIYNITLARNIIDNMYTNTDNKELIKFIRDFTAKMLICTYYETKVNKVSFKSKADILRNSSTINMRVRSGLFLLNTRLFYLIEELQRNKRKQL